MKEQAYQKKIIDFLKSKGAYVVKIISASQAGVPDVICCYRGRFVAVEVKRPETVRNVSRLQAYNLDKIQEAGGIGFVAYSKEQVAKVLEAIDEAMCSVQG